jgi:hypothetical protein
MAALWRVVELFIAGPLGMLLIQTTTFLIGAYLIFSRYMSPRRAAITATLLLWFPPIASVMAVIWKDSQMTGFMLLGLGLILQDSRRARIGGLVAFVAATAMRHNALILTGPLIFICFVWDDRHGFIKRHAVAFAAFAAVFLMAQGINTVLTSEEQHVWHTQLALGDMAGTLRYAPALPAAEVAQLLEGVTVLQPDPQEFAHRHIDETELINTLWKTTGRLFRVPRTEAERTAVARAWRRMVRSHFDAYFEFRWQIYRRLLGFLSDDNTAPSPVYNWFADIQDPILSADRAGQDANPGRIQELLRQAIHVIALTPIFNVMMYLILAVLLIPFSFGDRRVFALLISGLIGEATLFVLVPTPDWRYSYSMILGVLISIVLIVARRARPAAT